MSAITKCFPPNVTIPKVGVNNSVSKGNPALKLIRVFFTWANYLNEMNRKAYMYL